MEEVLQPRQKFTTFEMGSAKLPFHLTAETWKKGKRYHHHILGTLRSWPMLAIVSGDGCNPCYLARDGLDSGRIGPLQNTLGGLEPKSVREEEKEAFYSPWQYDAFQSRLEVRSCNTSMWSPGGEWSHLGRGSPWSSCPQAVGELWSWASEVAPAAVPSGAEQKHWWLGGTELVSPKCRKWDAQFRPEREVTNHFISEPPRMPWVPWFKVAEAQKKSSGHWKGFLGLENDQTPQGQLKD